MTANDNTRRTWIEMAGGRHVLWSNEAADNRELAEIIPIPHGCQARLLDRKREPKAFPDVPAAKAWVERMMRPYWLR